MTISMHQASVPLFKRQLGALLNWLDKAEAHATARKFDPNNYLQLRLAPDMLPFVSQIRIASDAAKGCVARLAGVEPPKFEDNELSFGDLQARIDKTIHFIEHLDATKLDGSETRAIHLKVGGKELHFVGSQYLMGWAWPNFHFHMTTAYCILRHNGVPLGKADFLGEV